MGVVAGRVQDLRVSLAAFVATPGLDGSRAALENLLSALTAAPGEHDAADIAAMSSLLGVEPTPNRASDAGHEQRSYVSIFNMVVREQWEGRLNDFLAWALAQAPAVVLWLFRRAGVDGAVRVEDVTAREGGAAGIPDLVLRARDSQGRPLVLAMELKIGASPTPLQRTDYADWRAGQDAHETAYLLSASRARTDLVGPRFIPAEDVLAELESAGIQVPLSNLIADARDWFFDPEVSAAAVVAALASDPVPFWPTGRLLSSLQSRVNELSGDIVWAGKIASDRGNSRGYRGFKVLSGSRGTAVAWVGVYVWEDEGYFYVNLKNDFLAPETATTLGFEAGSGVASRPLCWHPEARTWTAGGLAACGLDGIVRALVAAAAPPG